MCTMVTPTTRGSNDMPTYQVYLQQMAGTSITVEADDLDEAMEKAYDNAPGGLCAHCSGAFGNGPGIDLSGDWQIADPAEDVIEVQP